jgi:uncharacterized protein (DUF983 family)
MRLTELQKEWDAEKNNFISLNEVARGSNNKYWWLCKEGHSWQATPNSRFNRKQTNCPYCSNQKVFRGFNDLASRFPSIAEQWDFEANFGLEPSEIAFGSGIKVNWKCENKHTWTAAIFKRTINGSKCPFCSNRRVWAGYNDLQTRFPKISEEYSLELNGDLKPDQLLFSSKQAAFWNCRLGHTWKTSVYHRTRSNTGCPTCANKVIIAGFNDLETSNPGLKLFWDVHKNLPKRMADYSPHSSKSAWWNCNFGHSYLQSIEAKVRGNGCPVCSNYQIQTGINDLAFTHPELAAEWHPTKNGQLTPEEIVSGSHKRFWWLCANGHSWQAQPVNRASGNGCPACAVSGFKFDKPSILYFIVNEKLMSRKVGITNFSTDRLKRFEQRGWREIRLWKFDEGVVPNAVETEFFRWLRKDLKIFTNLQPSDMSGTGGWTEAFSLDFLHDEEVIEKIEALIEKETFRQRG